MVLPEHSIPDTRQQRLRIPSKNLKRLLEIANGVTVMADLSREIPADPSPQEVADTGSFQKAFETRWANMITTLIDSWGATAKRYVLRGRTFAEWDERYAEAIALRDLLNSLAAKNQGRTKTEEVDILIDLPESVQLVRSLKLRLRGSPGRAALEPRGLLGELFQSPDLDRIKRCSRDGCNRLFFAGRMNRPCCRERCRNAYKQKQHREREKGNRLYRKGLKKGER
jgi:predicted RNA-binding Zn ribbon-like protein